MELSVDVVLFFEKFVDYLFVMLALGVGAGFVLFDVFVVVLVGYEVVVIVVVCVVVCIYDIFCVVAFVSLDVLTGPDPPGITTQTLFTVALLLS